MGTEKITLNGPASFSGSAASKASWMNNSHMRFATRRSKLARWQTSHIVETVSERWPDLSTEEIVLGTSGDVLIAQPLPEIGGKGLFTAELDSVLLEGNVEAVVHSLKDLPIEDGSNLIIAAIPQRAPAHDVLLNPKGQSLDDLPEGAIVGTSSLRRQAQLLARRPDLKVQSIRGNVDTRIQKMLNREFDAIVLAAAGVIRLGLEEHVTQDFPLEIMLPAPGQGALAIQCRSDDESTIKYLAFMEHKESRKAVEAERAFLAQLGGGCSLPVGAYAEVKADSISLRGRVISTDGRRQIDVSGEGKHAKELGAALGEEALAQGAAELLDV